MKKTNYQADANKNLYCTPECTILEIKTEGILCSSSWAEKFLKSEDLTNDDYSQIF